MKLKADEQRMLSGQEGPAKKAAMEFLVKYAEGLGAEDFVDTNNVHSLLPFNMYPDVLTKKLDIKDIDEWFSRSLLDSDEKIVVDHVKAFTTTHITFIDKDYAHDLECTVGRDPKNIVEIIEKQEEYAQRIGMTLTNTCVPYNAGSLPVKGEHLAWCESSAIAFANSVIGARTNIEGDHSSFAAAITGKIPNWGMHLDKNRHANVIINVTAQPETELDWGLLGFFTGARVGMNVPAYCGIKTEANYSKLLSLACAGTTSGAVIMFHVVGITPEATTLEEAVGDREVIMTLEYGEKERRETYERVNFGKSKYIDRVLMGCPHLPISEICKIADLLDGKTCKAELLLFTNRQTRELAKTNGAYDKIAKAGGKIIIDSCPGGAKGNPSDTVATDSVKTGPTMAGFKGWKSVWLGTQEQCIDAAITGEWRGEFE